MSQKGLVLVTGGSGYIAGFCIRQLLAEGWGVRTTVRSLSREKEVRDQIGGDALDASRLSFVAADLSSDNGWTDAVAGTDYVLHVASPIPTVNPKDDMELVAPARDGTLRVLKAARDAGVKRVVVTSSVAAIAYGGGGRPTPFTEADWSDETNKTDSSAYERSKTIAERAAWDFMKREGGALQMATVNPGAVLGPVMGKDYSASLEIVLKLLNGSVPACPRFGWPLVDVRDVADLHVRAMTNPAAVGQRYIAASEFGWMKDVAGMLKARLGDRAKKVPAGNLPDVVLRLLGLFDPIIGARMFELGKERRASSDKARKELGWTPRPVADTVADCGESLIAHGAV
jgi:dihydroflavonol-4-reductase